MSLETHEINLRKFQLNKSLKRRMRSCEINLLESIRKLVKNLQESDLFPIATKAKVLEQNFSAVVFVEYLGGFQRHLFNF